MRRDAIESAILKIFAEKFEIEAPGVDEDLRDGYEFDSIDAIELLHEIEIMLDTQLTRAEKKNAMEIRTINQIVDYAVALAAARCQTDSAGPECLSTTGQ
ncbi:MAG: acyl carrier protein [Desulfobacterales bacterium]|jgi:acyl carrier protein